VALLKRIVYCFFIWVGRGGLGDTGPPKRDVAGWGAKMGSLGAISWEKVIGIVTDDWDVCHDRRNAIWLLPLIELQCA
jgi:hypothetical protein